MPQTFDEAKVRRGHNGHEGQFTYKELTAADVALLESTASAAGLAEYEEWLADDLRLPVLVRAVSRDPETGQEIVARDYAFSDEEMFEEFLNRKRVEIAEAQENEALISSVRARFDAWRANPDSTPHQTLVEDSATEVMRDMTDAETYLKFLDEQRTAFKASAVAESRFEKWKQAAEPVPFRKFTADGQGLQAMSDEEVRQMLHVVEGFDKARKAAFYKNPTHMVWNGVTPVDTMAPASFDLYTSPVEDRPAAATPTLIAPKRRGLLALFDR